MAEVRRWKNWRRVIVAGIGLIVLVVGYYLSAYPRGMITAWFDCSRGHYRVKSAGLPVRWYREYCRLLRERYGVEDEAIADCEVYPDVDWYLRGYNSISEPRILARFGKDIFAECHQEARTAWYLAHPDK
jgi:hypothetical protein